MVKIFLFSNKLIYSKTYIYIETFKPLYKLYQTKNDKERNYFGLGTVLEMPSSHAKMRLKSAPQKLNFLMAKDVQKKYTLNCSLKCPCTFPHIYALLRRLVFEKKHFMGN